MNKFGICNYNFDSYNSIIENLEIFDTYDEAYNRYKERLLLNVNKSNLFRNKNLWLVYIDEFNRIVQFEQLDWKVKCKIFDIGV